MRNILIQTGIFSIATNLFCISNATIILDSFDGKSPYYNAELSNAGSAYTFDFNNWVTGLFTYKEGSINATPEKDTVLAYKNLENIDLREYQLNIDLGTFQSPTPYSTNMLFYVYINGIPANIGGIDGKGTFALATENRGLTTFNLNDYFPSEVLSIANDIKIVFPNNSTPGYERTVVIKNIALALNPNINNAVPKHNQIILADFSNTPDPYSVVIDPGSSNKFAIDNNYFEFIEGSGTSSMFTFNTQRINLPNGSLQFEFENINNGDIEHDLLAGPFLKIEVRSITGEYLSSTSALPDNWLNFKDWNLIQTFKFKEIFAGQLQINNPNAFDYTTNIFITFANFDSGNSFRLKKISIVD